MKSKYQIPSVAVPILAIITIALLGSSTASAQSSGNFASAITTTQCVVNTVGGTPTSGSLSGGSAVTTLDTHIKTPNSSFTTLLITPSLVTGLFTNTEITQAMQSSAVSAAVKVFVTLDDKPVLPDNPLATYPGNGIIYDQRFQQLSTNVFSQLFECSISGNCSMDLVESTLAAHSFNFVAPNVGGGNHHLVVSWLFQCTDNTGADVPCTTVYTANTAGACAGPGTVTVTQTKAFSQSGGITVGP
jgi:hypothetical protein